MPPRHHLSRTFSVIHFFSKDDFLSKEMQASSMRYTSRLNASAMTSPSCISRPKTGENQQEKMYAFNL